MLRQPFNPLAPICQDEAGFLGVMIVVKFYNTLTSRFPSLYRQIFLYIQDVPNIFFR